MAEFYKSRELHDEIARLVLKYAVNEDEREAAFNGNDPRDFLIGLKVMEAIKHEVQRLEIDWIYNARRSGISWDSIGEALHCSKQSAQKKFASKIVDDFDHPFSVMSRSANALTEMGIAQNEGARGYELISVGPSSLAFRKSDDRWEYRRLCRREAHRAQNTNDDGWVTVCSSFPFVYQKRKLPDITKALTSLADLSRNLPGCETDHPGMDL